jgi:hypothetical protein
MFPRLHWLAQCALGTACELVATVQITVIDNTPVTIDEQHRVAGVLALIRKQLSTSVAGRLAVRRGCYGRGPRP